MLDWLRRLLRRKKSIPDSKESMKMTKTDIPEIAEKAEREQEKLERVSSIREKNLERRRNVLGSGLKSRNFRPRPAHEKKLWKMEKKAEDD